MAISLPAMVTATTMDITTGTTDPARATILAQERVIIQAQTMATMDTIPVQEEAVVTIIPAAEVHTIRAPEMAIILPQTYWAQPEAMADMAATEVMAA